MAGGAVLGTATLELEVDDSRLKSQLDTTRRDTDQWLADMSRSMKDAGKKMSTYLTLPIVGVGAATLKTAGDFERSMNRVAALSEATGDELDSLRRLAIQLGRDTQYSASDAADAMGYLAQAGFTVNEIIGAMPSVLGLAAATQMDLASTADVTSGIMRGYGITTQELAHANDVLVQTCNRTNAEMFGLGEAFKYAGPVAKSAGMSFEEAAAAIGMMGNAGIQGSMAGTSLRQAIVQLLDPPKAAAEALDRLGVSVTDSSGKLLPLVDILEQLEAAGADTTDMINIFGIRAGPAMQALLEQGTPALRDLTREMENSGGSAQRVAEIQMRGLNGQIEQLKGSIETLLLTIADTGLLSDATAFVGKLAEWTNALSQVNPQMLKLGIYIAGVTAAAGPALWVIGSLLGVYVKLGQTLASVARLVTSVGSKLVGEAKNMAELERAGNAAANAKKRVGRANDELAKSAGGAASALAREAGVLGQLASAAGGVAGGLLRGIGSIIGGMLGGVIATVGVSSILSGLASALASVAAGAVAALTAPVTLIALAIIGLLVAAFMVWEHWSEISTFLGNLVAQMGAWLGQAGATVGPALGNLLNAALVTLQTWGTNLLAFVASIPQRIVQFFIDLPGRICELLLNLAYLAGFAVGLFLAAFQLALQWLAGLPGQIGQFIGQLGAVIINGLTAAWTWIATEVPQWPGRFLAFLGGLLDLMGDLWGQVQAIIWTALQNLWAWISTEVPQWPGRIWDFLIGLVGQMGTLWNNVKTTVTNLLMALWQWINVEVPMWPGRFLAFLASLPGLLENLLADAKAKAIAVLTALWSWVTTEVPQWPGRFFDMLKSLPDKIKQAIDDAKERAVEALINLRDKVSEWANNIKEAILGPIRGVVDGIRQIFNDIIDAFRRGMEDAKKAMGISSPSKEFLKIGRAIVEGFELGLQGLSTNPLAVSSPGAALSGSLSINRIDELIAALGSSERSLIGQFTYVANQRAEGEETVRDVLDSLTFRARLAGAL